MHKLQGMPQIVVRSWLFMPEHPILSVADVTHICPLLEMPRSYVSMEGARVPQSHRMA